MPGLPYKDIEQYYELSTLKSYFYKKFDIEFVFILNQEKSLTLMPVVSAYVSGYIYNFTSDENEKKVPNHQVMSIHIM